MAIARCRGRDRSQQQDRKSTRLNSSHSQISYAVFCLKKKKDSRRNTVLSLEGDNRPDHCATERWPTLEPGVRVLLRPRCSLEPGAPSALSACSTHQSQ